MMLVFLLSPDAGDWLSTEPHVLAPLRQSYHQQPARHVHVAAAWAFKH